MKSEEFESFFMDSEEIQSLFRTCEKYLGRQLTSVDQQVLYGLHDWFHMELSVIEYLIEYCVLNGHYHIRYIEKVALGWANNEVKTLEDAKKMTIKSKAYRDVLKLLDINTTTITKHQKELLDKWLTWFEYEMILFACERAKEVTDRPNLKYIDAILNNWHQNQVKTLEDIKELDKRYLKQKKIQERNNHELIQENTYLRNEIARLSAENEYLKKLLYERVQVDKSI